VEQYQHRVRPAEHFIVLENSVAVRVMKMTRTKALCLNFGEVVWLEWSELTGEILEWVKASDTMMHLTLNGFQYHVTIKDFVDFAHEQVILQEVIGC